MHLKSRLRPRQDTYESGEKLPRSAPDRTLHQQLSYHKGSCKRLKPQEMQVKVKQAVKKPIAETTRLGNKQFEQATASRQKLDEWKKAQMKE